MNRKLLSADGNNIWRAATASVSIAVGLALSACGGGGTTGQAISGKIMDGYIKGATVCFDTNKNAVCDSGEPSAVTTAGGAFVLNLPESATLGAANLLVSVPVGAIDEDDPSTPIATAYTMRGVAKVASIVSPLTTLIAAHMDDNMSEADAAQAALTTLGLSGFDPKADYVAAANVKVHNVAKVLAGVLQQASTQTPSALKTTISGLATSWSTAYGSAETISKDVVANLSKLVKAPTTSGLVSNGDFETGTATGWSGNAANVVTENGNSYNFANVAAAGNPWDVNLSYVLDIPKEGVRYKLTFDAFSDKQGRQLKAGIGLNGDPWTNTVQDLSLTTSSQTFTLYLTSNFASANSRIIFDMGHDSGIVGIDNVKLEVASANLITNGNFETGTTAGWSGNAANVVTENGNSYNFANVAAAGNPWDVNLSYVLDIPKADVRYKLTFDAFSDKTGRKLKAGIGLNSDPWTNVVEDVSLTTTSQTVTLYLTSNFASANSRIIFDMGHDSGVVGIDNVSLELAPADTSNSGGGTSSAGAPTAAAMTPSARDTQNVVSVFSDAYTSIAVNEWGPDWGGSSARIVDVTVDGGAVKRITMGSGQAFAGISFTGAAFDATPFTHFHMDYWIASPVTTGQVLDAKLSNHNGGSGETSAIQTTVTALTAGQWQSIDVPLSSFLAASASGDLSRNAIAQLVLSAARADMSQPVDIYIDNIYFYK